MKETKIELVREIREILKDNGVFKNSSCWFNPECGNIVWVSRTRVGHSSVYDGSTWNGHCYDVPLYDKSTTLEELKQIKEALLKKRYIK